MKFKLLVFLLLATVLGFLYMATNNSSPQQAAMPSAPVPDEDRNVPR